MEKIIKELSKKYNLPMYVIEQVVESQFQFVRDMMKESKLEGAILTNFGKFVVKPGKKKRYWEVQEAKKRRKEREELENQLKSNNDLEETKNKS